MGIEAAPRHQAHGPSSWRGPSVRWGFRGVAPDASPRLYLVPKPGLTWSRCRWPSSAPRARGPTSSSAPPTSRDRRARCSTTRSTSPRASAGAGAAPRCSFPPAATRRARPAPPTRASRSTSRSRPAIRASSASPRGRDGGWFTWIDRRGRARPFANRGPSVRWLAPGDDVAYPFAAGPRLCHAESSGASAIAAGALLLVLAENPALTRAGTRRGDHLHARSAAAREARGRAAARRSARRSPPRGAIATGTTPSTATAASTPAALASPRAIRSPRRWWRWARTISRGRSRRPAIRPDPVPLLAPPRPLGGARAARGSLAAHASARWCATCASSPGAPSASPRTRRARCRGSSRSSRGTSRRARGRGSTRSSRASSKASPGSRRAPPPTRASPAPPPQ